MIACAFKQETCINRWFKDHFEGIFRNWLIFKQLLVNVINERLCVQTQKLISSITSKFKLMMPKTALLACIGKCKISIYPLPVIDSFIDVTEGRRGGLWHSTDAPATVWWLASFQLYYSLSKDIYLRFFHRYLDAYPSFDCFSSHFDTWYEEDILVKLQNW